MNFSNIKNFRPKKTTVVLLVALFVGLIAALATRSYLSHKVEELESKAKGARVEVVVASADMKPGDVVTEETVSIRSMPQEFAHVGALLPADFDRAKGEQLAHPVKAGQMIIWGLLENKRAPAFSSRVEIGRRAMTVPVDEINSISGMLEPGDIIDLMVTVDQQGNKTTFPLLQTIKVMATGQKWIDDPKSGERRDFSTVTLDITAEQARHVIAAREGGKITALLRNPGDSQRMPESGVDVHSLLSGKVARSPQASTVMQAPTDSSVPVLYGGSQGGFTPEQLEMGGKRLPDLLRRAMGALTVNEGAEATSVGKP